MAMRKHSPAPSVDEVDISGQLFQDEDNDAEIIDAVAPSSNVEESSNAAIPNLLEGSDVSEDDDENFIAAAQAASNRKTANIKGRSVKKGGGFQVMGLNASLLKAITRKGFSVPTPIQRKTIPLVLDGQDVVGMARTGSGKTAAFVIPMIQRLKAHSAKVGARALIMSPSRELALQTLKVVKEMGKGTDLKCVLLVGGDSLEDQFGYMTANPDIIIATPGRFLHLKVEMSLDLSSIRYVVFDEADRLFEMGFAPQLGEILHNLPPNRQTLLFSATLPSSLVEFARAGLQEPQFTRLDAESKISPDLQSAFFSVKGADKEGALLHIIQDIIKIPTGETEAALKAREPNSSKKRKRTGDAPREAHTSPTRDSTIVFAATWYHVEYLSTLLKLSGYAVSYVYGNLDQTARKIQVSNFRQGLTNILVVTDVAARGIDIPILANVINYDFPAQPKLFVHRVGRTARAGQRGWSYSLMREGDAPYLLDLQLFLGRKLVVGRQDRRPNFAHDVVVGELNRDRLANACENVAKLLENDSDAWAQRNVAARAEVSYLRTRNSASSESAKRARQISGSKEWTELHPLFGDAGADGDGNVAAAEGSRKEREREQMLAIVSGFRPQETIFEIGKRGHLGGAGEVVKKRREAIARKKERARGLEREGEHVASDANMKLDKADDEVADVEMAAGDDWEDDGAEDDDDLEVTISQPGPGSDDRDDPSSQPRPKKKVMNIRHQDSEFFMSYTPANINMHEDRGYGVATGSSSTNFLTDARAAQMDLVGDEGAQRGFAQPSRVRWDKRSKKYVRADNDTDGSKSKSSKMVKSESGGKIPAGMKSGRFDRWKKSNRIDRMPRVGDAEGKTVGKQARGPGGQQAKSFRHRQEKAPKNPDKFRDDYYKQKKLVEKAKEDKRGRFADSKTGRIDKCEVKDNAAIRKDRATKEKRREKTARPSRKPR